jgi:hypothetical protein
VVDPKTIIGKNGGHRRRRGTRGRWLKKLFYLKVSRSTYLYFDNNSTLKKCFYVPKPVLLLLYLYYINVVLWQQFKIKKMFVLLLYLW